MLPQATKMHVRLRRRRVRAVRGLARARVEARRAAARAVRISADVGDRVAAVRQRVALLRVPQGRRRPARSDVPDFFAHRGEDLPRARRRIRRDRLPPRDRCERFAGWCSTRDQFEDLPRLARRRGGEHGCWRRWEIQAMAHQLAVGRRPFAGIEIGEHRASPRRAARAAIHNNTMRHPAERRAVTDPLLSRAACGRFWVVRRACASVAAWRGSRADRAALLRSSRPRSKPSAGGAAGQEADRGIVVDRPRGVARPATGA